MPEAAGSSGDHLVDEAPLVNEFIPVPNQPAGFTFTAVSGQGEGSRTFNCSMKWLDGFKPGCTLKFSVFPGRSEEGFLFCLPNDDSIVGKTLLISANVETQATRAQSFRATRLLRKLTNEEMEKAIMANAEKSTVQKPDSSLPDVPNEELRQPIQSHILPPIAEETVFHELGQLGWQLGAAAKNGDCFPLSVLASSKLITNRPRNANRIERNS